MRDKATGKMKEKWKTQRKHWSELESKDREKGNFLIWLCTLIMYSIWWLWCTVHMHTAFVRIENKCFRNIIFHFVPIIRKLVFCRIHKYSANVLFQETDARVYSDILFCEMLENGSETGFVISQTKDPMLQNFVHSRPRYIKVKNKRSLANLVMWFMFDPQKGTRHTVIYMVNRTTWLVFFYNKGSQLVEGKHLFKWIKGWLQG